MLARTLKRFAAAPRGSHETLCVQVASLDSPLEGVSPAATSPAIDADMVV